MRSFAFVICTFYLVYHVHASAKASNVRKLRSQAPEKDDSISCLGPEGEQVCCNNCTSCCQEHNQCNFGEGNSGWGNIGDDNFGDFNIANNTFGDCNVEDDSYGIGGPEYNGCAKEAEAHMLRFCSINPHFIKCHHPPSYYGEELIEQLKAVVLKCDATIKVSTRQSASGNRRRQRTSRAKMPRVRVSRTGNQQPGGTQSSTR